MSIKIIFGILLPLAVIFFVIIFNTGSIGIVLENRNVVSVPFNSIVVDKTSYTDNDNIILRKVTITNYLFIPKIVELSWGSACLYDLEGSKPRNYYLPYSYISNDVTIVEMHERFEGQDPYMPRAELPPFSKTEFEIIATPILLEDYGTPDSYKDYYLDYDLIVFQDCSEELDVNNSIVIEK